MLLPAIIYIFIFCYVPMYGVQLAFRGYDFKAGIYGGKWVGFKYFKQYFDSAMFGTTLRNTFITAALSIVLGFSAPIVLAMIINQIRQQKWKRIVQTTVYIPYFISTVVIKFLGENPGACPWDEAKKYFSKSLMSISSEYNRSNSIKGTFN